MTDANYYVVATYGPFTRGNAQNAVWDIEEAARDSMEDIPVNVIIKHAAD